MRGRLTKIEIQERIDNDDNLDDMTVIRVGVYECSSHVTVKRKSCGHVETKQTMNLLNGLGCKHCKILTTDKIKKELKDIHGDKLSLIRFTVKDDVRFCRVVWKECGHMEDRHLTTLRKNIGCSKCKSFFWYKD